jgi:hypothetical protein
MADVVVEAEERRGRFGHFHPCKSERVDER